MPKPRGVPEVPMKLDGGPQHRDFLVNLREQLLQLRQRTAVPDAPANLKATAQSFQNLIQFTRSTDADYYELIVSLSPNQKDPGAYTLDIGNSVQYQDTVGQANVARWYWVRARKLTGAASVTVGPVTATTLASGTGVMPPSPPPPATIVVLDQATGQRIPYVIAQPRTIR